MCWLYIFIIPGPKKSHILNIWIKKKINLRNGDGQSCVMLPDLDCLDCENWKCKVLERGGASQKRDSQKGEVVLGKILGERRKGEGREKGGQGGKKLQEVEGEDWSWRIKLESRGRFQRCVDSNAGDSQERSAPVQHSQLPWVSIYVPSGNWKPTEPSVVGGDSEQ